MIAKIVLFILRGLSWLPLSVARSLSRLLARLMVAVQCKGPRGFAD